MPFCLSSPQFFNRAISKSNLLLAVNCFCCSICVLAASLHSSCNFPSRGHDRVALIPIFKLLLAFISVLIGSSHITSPGLSGMPSGPSTSIVICISAPSSNHLVVSPSSFT